MYTSNEYRSSVAVDLNYIDQVIDSVEPTLVRAQQKIWDLSNSFNLNFSGFNCPVNGIWGFDGSFRLKDLTNVRSVQLLIYQNYELWFIAQETAVIEDHVQISTSCLCDGLVDNSDVFQIYLKMEPIDPLLPVTGTLDGSRETTAWGFDLRREVEAVEVLSDD
jgi:hypothetical protein